MMENVYIYVYKYIYVYIVFWWFANNEVTNPTAEGSTQGLVPDAFEEPPPTVASARIYMLLKCELRPVMFLFTPVVKYSHPQVAIQELWSSVKIGPAHRMPYTEYSEKLQQEQRHVCSRLM